MFHIAESDKTFIYELDEKGPGGVNRWWAKVYAGNELDNSKTSQESVEAIAKLLAAAPALYEALDVILKNMTTADIYSSEGLHDAYDAAKAALAAAK